MNRHVTGQIDANTLRIRSCFRSSADYSARCLALAAYRRNRVVVGCDIDPRIDSHSVVSVVSNDSIVNCLVSWYIADWVENTHEIELNWLEAWQ